MQQKIQSLYHSLTKTLSNFKKKIPNKSTNEKKPEKIINDSKSNITRTYIDISALNIIKITLIVILGYYLTQIFVQIFDVLVWLFIAIIITATLTPIVDWFQEKKVPRIITTLFLYLFMFGFLILTLVLIIPILSAQIQDLANNVKGFFNTIIEQGPFDIPIIGNLLTYLGNYWNEWELASIWDQIDKESLINTIQETLKNWGSNLTSLTLDTIVSLFGGVATTITVLVLSFYMIIEKDSLSKSLVTLIPTRYENYLIKQALSIQDKMGAWLSGQLFVCFILGFLAWFFMTLIGVKYALTLGIITGIMAIIPYIGAFMSAIFSIIIALTQSFWLAIGVIIIYIGIQALEGNIITPLIMRKAVGLNAVTVMVSLLIGGTLYGIMGIILAIPFTTALVVFIDEYAAGNK